MRIKWKAIADMRDADAPGSQSVGMALQRYESELAQNVSTVERLQATNPKIWVPLTVRGLHRFNQIGWGGQDGAAGEHPRRTILPLRPGAGALAAAGHL